MPRRPTLGAVLAAAFLAPAAAAPGATVTFACVAPGEAGEGCTPPPIVVQAAPGESNRITVGHDATGVIVRDAGAPLRAARGCAAVVPGVVRCEGAQIVRSAERDPLPLTVRAGDGDDHVDVSGFGRDAAVDLTIEGGAGADVLVAGDVLDPRRSSLWPEPYLRGGPGDDTLVGGRQGDVLIGGPGADLLRGGAGDDRLFGDVEGEPGPDAIGDDVVDGGPGSDTVSWEGRGAALTVDLADRGPDGSPGEADQLADVENVLAGSGPATLRGDAGPNVLGPADPQDVRRVRAFGRGGDDALTGGRADGGTGDDVLAVLGAPRCGPGTDVVRRLGRAPRVPPLPARCERMDLAGLVFDPRAVRARGRALTLRAASPERDEGTLSVRVRGRTAGRRHLDLGPRTRRVRVPLRRRAAPRARVVVRFSPLTPGLPAAWTRVRLR